MEMDNPDKPNIARRWQTEEAGFSPDERWGILVQATLYNGEEMLAWGWVPIHDPDAPTSTVTLHRDAAITLMRSLYSAYAALHDPQYYLHQIGLGWTSGGKAPESGMVGGAQDYGEIQIFADWSGDTRYFNFTVDPHDGDKLHVSLGIESIAHLVQLAAQAFETLQWPVSE